MDNHIQMPFFLMPFEVCHILENFLGPVCYANSNSHFYDLNHFTHISQHFFTHTNFKKLQKSHLKLLYQTPP